MIFIVLVGQHSLETVTKVLKSALKSYIFIFIKETKKNSLVYVKINFWIQILDWCHCRQCQNLHLSFLLAVAGCCWLLLAVTGCCWLLLAVAGCCWLLLVVVGYQCWLLPLSESSSLSLSPNSNEHSSLFLLS